MKKAYKLAARRPLGLKSPAKRRSVKPRARLVFILGGASSGKSALALKLCGALSPRAFVATGEPLDDEMKERIRAHQQARVRKWETVEIPVHLAEWFGRRGANYGGVVVDCLTLWLSNLLHRGMSEKDIPPLAANLLRSVRHVQKRVVIVSNEVGLGIVPVTKVSRKFRNLAGKVHQQVAQEADEVYWAISGIPVRLK